MKPRLCKSLNNQSLWVKSECMLLDSPASISWFQATALNFYKGIEPIFTLTPCVLEVRRASMPGQSEEYLPHRWTNEPTSNKETKRNLCWKCSIQADALLLDLNLWGCEGRVVVFHSKNREIIWKKPTQKNWEIEGDKLGPKAVFWTPVPSPTETTSLYELVNPLLWYKPIWSRFGNT